MIIVYCIMTYFKNGNYVQKIGTKCTNVEESTSYNARLLLLIYKYLVSVFNEQFSSGSSKSNVNIQVLAFSLVWLFNLMSKFLICYAELYISCMKSCFRCTFALLFVVSSIIIHSCGLLSPFQQLILWEMLKGISSIFWCCLLPLIPKV